MTAYALLADLRQRGIALEANGDRIRWQAPKGALTDLDRTAIREQKPEILVLLSRPSAAIIERFIEWFIAYGAPDASGLSAYVELRAWGVHVAPFEAGWRDFAARCNVDELGAVLRLLAPDDIEDPDRQEMAA